MYMTRPDKGATVRGSRLLPALVTIVSLVAAACGDGSSSDPAPETAPTTAATTSATTAATTTTAAPTAAAAPAEEAAVDDRNCVDEVVIGTVWPMSGTFSFVGDGVRDMADPYVAK